MHKFLRHAVTAYVNDDQSDWDNCLPAIMASYNDAVYQATIVTPVQASLGIRGTYQVCNQKLNQAAIQLCIMLNSSDLY